MNDMIISNVLNGDTKEQILEIIDKQLPGAHAELFTRYVKNSEMLKIEVKDLEDKIKCLREDINFRDNKILDMTGVIQALQDLKLRRDLIEKKEDELREKELKISHNNEINNLKLQNANNSTEMAVDLFKTVFKPATFRKEVQRSVGKVCSSGDRLEYDSYSNRQIKVSGGQHVETANEDETIEESED